MTEYERKVMETVVQAAIYIPFNCEGIRINYWDETDSDGEATGAFWGTGEDSGEEYKIYFCEVDLDQDLFYKLVAMNI